VQTLSLESPAATASTNATPYRVVIDSDVVAYKLSVTSPDGSTVHKFGTINNGGVRDRLLLQLFALATALQGIPADAAVHIGLTHNALLMAARQFERLRQESPDLPSMVHFANFHPAWTVVLPLLERHSVAWQFIDSQSAWLPADSIAAWDALKLNSNHR